MSVILPTFEDGDCATRALDDARRRSEAHIFNRITTRSTFVNRARTTQRAEPPNHRSAPVHIERTDVSESD